MRSALLFPDYFPASFEARSSDEIKRAAEIISTDRVVIKPVDGQEGKDVKISSEAELEKLKEEPQEPMIVQEFISTEEGIPGVTDKIHDLRVLIMNGEIVQVYVRTPREGKLISNVSKGGSLKEIEVEDLPADIVGIIGEVDKKLSIYQPRIYSIDFGYSDNGPKIFELNSQPGLPYPKWVKYYKKWHQKLLETLLSSLKQ